MDEPDFLSSSTIAIIGLGLMGGSLALALRGKCKKMIGIDPDSESVAFAIQQGIIDQSSDDPAILLPQADVVILAAPVSAIIQWITDLPGYHPGEAIVLDLGSTKRNILQAMEKLPPRFSPIGGHPVCGKEKLSIRNADASIFHQACFIFSPLLRTPESTKQFASHLAETISAFPIWLPADEHDRVLAATSHVPYLIASALASTIDQEHAPLLGTGFRSTARLAATPSSMMLDVLKSNNDNVVAALEIIREQIDQQISSLKQGEYSELKKLLDKSAQQYLHLIPDRD